MNGYEKIAVLLAELGNGAREAVLENLKLTPEQLKKINAATKKIKSYDGKVYNPKDPQQVQRELSVLEELKSFGELRGIYRDVPHEGFIKTGNPSDIRNQAMADPELIARALGQWLSKDE